MDKIITIEDIVQDIIQRYKQEIQCNSKRKSTKKTIRYLDYYDYLNGSVDSIITKFQQLRQKFKDRNVVIEWNFDEPELTLIEYIDESDEDYAERIVRLKERIICKLLTPLQNFKNIINVSEIEKEIRDRINKYEKQ